MACGTQHDLPARPFHRSSNLSFDSFSLRSFFSHHSASLQVFGQAKFLPASCFCIYSSLYLKHSSPGHPLDLLLQPTPCSDVTFSVMLSLTSLLKMTISPTGPAPFILPKFVFVTLLACYTFYLSIYLSLTHK